MVKAQALFSRKWLGEVPVFGLGQAGPVTLTDANFSQALSAPKAVVDFWSPSCPACMIYKPVFEEVAASSGGIFMGMAKGEDAPQAAGQYGIEGIPTTIFFVNGAEVNRVEGAMPKDRLQAEMAKAFGGGVPVSSGAPSGYPAPSGGPGVLGIALGGLALAGLAAGALYLATRK